MKALRGGCPDVVSLLEAVNSAPRPADAYLSATGVSGASGVVRRVAGVAAPFPVGSCRPDADAGKSAVQVPVFRALGGWSSPSALLPQELLELCKPGVAPSAAQSSEVAVQSVVGQWEHRASAQPRLAWHLALLEPPPREQLARRSPVALPLSPAEPLVAR